MRSLRTHGVMVVALAACASGCFEEQSAEPSIPPEPTVTEVRGACTPGVVAPPAGLVNVVEIPSWGGNKVFVEDINDDGVAVGGQTTAEGVFHAFRHTDVGGIQDVGALSGFGGMSFASAIAVNGAISGHSDRADGTGVLFGFGYTASAGRVGVCAGGCSVWDLNSKGQHVGLFPGRDPTTWQAFVFSSRAGVTLLGTLGGPRSSASSVSEAGLVVGNSQLAGAEPGERGHAFIYDSSAATPVLRDLNQVARASGWVLQAANEVNDKYIVGYGLRGTAVRAFRMEIATGAVIDLGTLPDAGDSQGWSVDRYGDVVGWSATSQGGHVAFIYAPGLGGMRRLDEFVDLAQGWRFRQASGINAHGAIVGWGSRMGVPRGFKITFPMCVTGT